MTKYDKPLLALGLFASWGMTFDVLKNFLDAYLLLISDSVIWILLSGVCFYLLSRKPKVEEVVILSAKQNKDEIIIKKKTLINVAILLATLLEGSFALVIGIANWQTVPYNGTILFTLPDFVSISLITVGVVFLGSFVFSLLLILEKRNVT